MCPLQELLKHRNHRKAVIPPTRWGSLAPTKPGADSSISVKIVLYGPPDTSPN